ncbi:MAG: hypothetical protein ABSF85_03775 [Terriglobales bacterium]
MVDRNVQLHGCTQYTLQQGVVQFLRHPRAFGEPFFKANMELSGVLVKPQTIEAKYRERHRDYTYEGDPPSLPECRFGELDPGARTSAGTRRLITGKQGRYSQQQNDAKKANHRRGSAKRHDARQTVPWTRAVYPS